jgi:hypothetical protein
MKEATFKPSGNRVRSPKEHPREKFQAGEKARQLPSPRSRPISHLKLPFAS